MEIRVGGILKLQRSKRIRNACSQLFGAPDSALDAFRIRCAVHFSTERLHDLDFLPGKPFGHEEHHTITLIHTNKRQANTGIAGGGLNDGGTRPQQTLLLGPADHAHSRAVLHAATWIQVFQLGINLTLSRRGEPGEMEHGCAAREFDNVLRNPNPKMSGFKSFHGSSSKVIRRKRRGASLLDSLSLP